MKHPNPVLRAREIQGNPMNATRGAGLIPSKQAALNWLGQLRMVVCAAFLISFAQPLMAVGSRDYVAEVTATTSPVSPCITLNWTNKSTATTVIYRRIKGAPAWESPVTIGSGIYTYADMTALPGIAYEYSFSPSSYNNAGGIVAGYGIPLVESRGKVILLVDQTMSVPLASEISQLQKNLIADGWTVIRHDVPRETVSPGNISSAVWAARIAEQQNIRAIIQADYNAAPGSNWALFILGRIPVPYSGQMAPDGHGDHYGAWPTDNYYADVDGAWIDTTVNTGTSGLADARNYNLVGDGKFDTNILPSDVELQCGRVDLSNMPGVPAGMTETELLRQYLVRDNRFRRVQAPFDHVARRGIVDDNFNYYAQTAWGSGFGFFGRDAGQMDVADWFGTLTTTPMLFAYGCGGGLFYGAAGIGESAWNFGQQDSKAVFTQLFGSWFGDWDVTNNFLRAPLAGTNNSLGLTCIWSGIGEIPLYHMALGDPIGYSMRRAQNNSGSTGDWFQGSSNRYIHQGLMGDPTLRLHSIAPPIKVTASSSSGGITINWQASPDSGLSGYHIYRSTSTAGPFARITGTASDGSNPTGSCLVAGTFTDTDSALAAGTSYTYLVKAVRVESTPSGTYANQSIGEAVTITHMTAAPTPMAPTQLVVSRTATFTCVLTWDDNATNETGYIVERCDPATGSWSQIASLAADANTCTDASSPAGKAVSYRVRAFNSNGSSDYSNAAADYSLPGTASGAGRYYEITKDSGVCSTGLTRSNGSTGDVSLTYSTVGILGTADVDYPVATGNLAWAHGTSGYKGINIPVPKPAGQQLTKIFQINYSNPSNGLALGTFLNPYIFVRDTTATLPSPWLTTTYGTVSGVGYAEHVNGTFGMTVQSQYGQRFIYQQVTGDFTFSTRVTNYPKNGTYDWAATGIAVRADLTNGAVNDTLSIGNDYGFGRGVRTAASGSTDFHWVRGFDMSLDKWLRIVRTGNTTTCYTSIDGTNWDVCGYTATLSALPATAYVGFIMDSGQGSNAPLAYGQFDGVTLNNGGSPAVGPTSSLSASPGTNAGEIALAWNAATNATTYQIERSTQADKGFVKIDAVAAPAITYTDGSPALNTTYYYRVMALNSGNNSAYSNVASAQAYNPYGPLGPITTITASPGGNLAEILLTWSAATQASAYLIEKSDSAAGPFHEIGIVAAPALTYTDRNVAAGAVCYYRIKPYNPVYTGAYSAVTSSVSYVPPTFAGWRFANFGSTAYIPGLSGNLDAPIGDGIANVMKCALGLNLFNANGDDLVVPPDRMPIIQPQTVNGTSYLTCSFIHSKAATDVVVRVEATSNLTDLWTEIDPFQAGNQISVTDNSPGTGLETIVVKDTQPLSASSKRFMRLKATDASGVLQILGAAATDPSGGATIVWGNPWFGEAVSNLSGEAFAPVNSTAMTAAQGASVLDFEQASGFGSTPYQLNAAGSLNPLPALAINKAVTAISTQNGSLKVEWRSYDMVNSILSAPDLTKGVYLVQDRSSSDGTPTMVSGSHGIMAQVVAGVSSGTYLTFEKNISKFSVVINSNALDYAPLVMLFDSNGVAIRKYYFGGVGKGLSTYYGISSPNSLIRSVWIGQNGTNEALILDDISFVPAP